VAVDGTALAVALLHDDERPVEVAPPVEVTPEPAPSVTEPEGAPVNSEVAFHEVDSLLSPPGLIRLLHTLNGRPHSLTLCRHERAGIGASQIALDAVL